MPRKQWAAFERVTAADVNATLADQAVMVFATTTARDAAIPSPTVGMESAVQASPDLGAPRFWDGSAWQLVQVGSATSAVWTRGNPDTSASEWAAATGAFTSGAWKQVSASLGVDVVITGLSGTFPLGIGNNTFDIGTGGAGSEVNRWTASVTSNNFIQASQGSFHLVCPYGVNVPNGTRVAVKWTGGNGPTSGANEDRLFIHYSKASITPTQFEGGATATAGTTSTAWTQVAASPPISGGCWVTGAYGVSGGASSGFGYRDMQFGLGASGSEVAATPYIVVPAGGVAGQVSWWIAPFWWPSGTRLAFRSGSSNPYTTTVGALWRESLA